MANFFEKIFDFLKHLVTRPGLQQFLQKYEQQAVQLVTELASVHNNADFKVWYQEAFEKAQADFNETKGTWISILINLAYESFKAKLPQPVATQPTSETPTT